MRVSTLQFTLLYCSIQCFQLSHGIQRESSSLSMTTQKSCLLCRGGQQQYSNDPYNALPQNNDYNPNSYNPQNLPQDPDHIFQEAFQDRVDQWRQEQIQHRDQMSFNEKTSLRDSKGRMKLMATAGKGARAFLFGILMWRNIHLMEVADKTTKGSWKSFLVGNLAILFMGNFAGVCAAITGSSGHAATKRFKAILNLDKLLEVVLLVWYLLRLTFIPNKHVPREIYIASIFHSIFFLIQSQSFTRISWDDKLFGAFGAKPVDEDFDDKPPGYPDASMNQYPPQNDNYEHRA
ncbi:unnamed protein product [Cylindrotheca closterium]|uniref:Uncharacterized protein n=1 Tax=Cylindrotheca closterium TaxID=2856 RepID=A0AAD2GAW5_9STRA|nr:unnamed protein product [Cylindrotheca closterium]